jgi:hypothetical protein
MVRKAGTLDKAEIIAMTIGQVSRTMVNQPPNSIEPDEEDFVISLLREVLPPGDIKTCDDFHHLNIECCQICHEYAAYEMSVVTLPDGCPAWLCDRVKAAIFPQQYRDSQETEELLRKIFGDPND